MSIPPSVAAFFPHAEVIHPKSLKPGRPLEKLDQIAFLVRDIDTAIEELGRLFGWGPFYVVMVDNEAVYRGIPTKYKLKLAFCQLGSLEIELQQVVEGNTPHREQLETVGPGFFHMRLISDDLSADLLHLNQHGISGIWEYLVDGQVLNSYTDSHLKVGFRAELIATRDQVAKMKKQEADAAVENFRE